MVNKYPTEAQEGATLVAYLRVKDFRFTHIANETGGTPEALRRAIQVKRQGVSKGFPDYLIIKNKQLIAIELKRVKGSVVKPEQREWLVALSICGVNCAICFGSAEAIEFIESIT